MLNALRHQWNLHAQVEVTCAIPNRAQRLTASMESSLVQLKRLLGGVSCSTPYGINGIFTSFNDPTSLQLVVLNALRHQWNLHRQPREAQQRAGFPCSTPYGINGIFTVSSAARNASASVLNALRHQWNLHTTVRGDLGWGIGAQRLTASMESSPFPFSHK